MTKNIASTTWGPFTAVSGSGDFESATPDGGENIHNFAPDWTYDASGGGSVELLAPNELKGTYPANASGTFLVRAKNETLEALNTDTLYIQFQAKMPNTTHGHKFVKIFGGRTDDNYANCTFILAYIGGGMQEVAYGDGAGEENDTQKIIRFNGSAPSQIGRSYQNGAVVSLPQLEAFAPEDWGTDYHDFKLYVKFNSGTTALNEVNDGEFYIEIDGKVYVDATGIFNRHYSNDFMQRVEFFGFTTGGPAEGFDMTYKNPRVSTTGFE